MSIVANYARLRTVHSRMETTFCWETDDAFLVYRTTTTVSSSSTRKIAEQPSSIPLNLFPHFQERGSVWNLKSLGKLFGAIQNPRIPYTSLSICCIILKKCTANRLKLGSHLPLVLQKLYQWELLISSHEANIQIPSNGIVTLLPITIITMLFIVSYADEKLASFVQKFSQGPCFTRADFRSKVCQSADLVSRVNGLQNSRETSGYGL